MEPETWPESGPGDCGVRIAVSSESRGGTPPVPGTIGPGPPRPGTPSRLGVSDELPVTGPVVGPAGPGVRTPGSGAECGPAPEGSVL
ncbi:hypothetical protein ACN24K_15400 [Streptomyces microflavus]